MLNNNKEIGSSRTAICLFTFNRLDELKKCIDSLALCDGVKDFHIIVFSDGARNDVEKKTIENIRNYLLENRDLMISEFRFSDENLGLANSIIKGLNAVFQKYDQVIVLEDDLIVSPNFIEFMIQALNFYEKDKNIFSISGYSPNLNSLKNYSKDVYFSPRASSWGLGIWRDRWLQIDWNIDTYSSFKYDFIRNWQFTQGGIDLPGMLRDQMNGRINSWAIRAVYNQFLNKQVSVYPSISKIKSIGFGKDATHTKSGKRFETKLDDGIRVDFLFEDFKSLDSAITKEFRRVFSIWNRLKDRFNPVFFKLRNH